MIISSLLLMSWIAWLRVVGLRILLKIHWAPKTTASNPKNDSSAEIKRRGLVLERQEEIN